MAEVVDVRAGESVVSDRKSPLTIPESDLNLGEIIHWSQGVMNTVANKHKFTRATENISQEDWKSACNIRPTGAMVVKLWESYGVRHRMPQYPADDFSRTPGEWFYIATLEWGFGVDIQNFKHPKVAYHASPFPTCPIFPKLA